MRSGAGVRDRFERASVAVKDGAPAEVLKQNASWIREGDYRLELRVNERVVAAGSLSLNVVVVEPRSAQAQSFPVLDSETIFDGAERRVGIGRVTDYKPLHLREVRARMETDAAAFRLVHPAEGEPRHYLARAVESLKTSPHIETKNADVLQAQRHLEAALTILDRLSGRPSVLVDMHHRAAFEQLERITAPRYLSEEQAMNDCVRARMAFDRNHSSERSRSALAVPGLVYHRTRG